MNSLRFVYDSSTCPPLRIAVVASESTIYVFREKSAPIELTRPNADDAKVTALFAHPSGLFVVGAFSSKQIYVWSLPDGVLISSAKVNKQSTSLALGSVNLADKSKIVDVLVTSDRVGETWGLDFPALSGQVLLLGHTASIITEVLITRDNSRIVSADRDEKIRVSNFPQTDSIHGFCLGHTNVVTSIAFTNDTSKFMVSCSWDNTMRLWNIESSLQLDAISFPSQQSMVSPSGEDEEVQAPGNAEAGIEADDEVAQDRMYDAKEAGNFPTKVVCFPVSHSHSLVGVAFWGLSTVKLYVVNHSETSANFARSADSLVAFDVSLPSAPCDIQLIKCGNDSSSCKATLVVLLSSTESNDRTHFKCFNCLVDTVLSVVENNISAASMTDLDSHIHHISEYFDAIESFRPVQRSVAVSEHISEHPQAFTRHAIERRFDSAMINPACKAKRPKIDVEQTSLMS